MKNLINWLENNNIDFQFENDNTVIIDEKKYFYIDRENIENYKLFDLDFNFCLTEKELDYLEKYNLCNAIFQFGYFFYYSDLFEPKLNILRNLGKSTKYSEVLPYIGIHTGFELLSSIGMPKDIVKKAKFLGYKTIAVCDNNSLASSFSLEKECIANDIKLIIGSTFKIENYQIKLFALNDIGWKNLCNIVSLINIEQIDLDIDFISEFSKGLTCVFGENYDFSNLDKYKKVFGNENLYYGIDLSEYTNSDRDNLTISRIKTYFNKHISHLKGVFCQDTTYIEKGQDFVLQFINRVGKINKYPSSDRYFKDESYIFERFFELFKNEVESIEYLDIIIKNCIDFDYKHTFKIDRKTRKLPKYELNKNETKIYLDNQDMFWNLIENGLETKVVNKNLNAEIYAERVEKEFSVIDKAGVSDYFLIFYDFVKYCNNNNILTGFGRGSAAGSLVSYLFDIVKIDPIEYNLLFERFLNEGRAMTTLPDIDLDIQDDKRDEARKYLQEKYGEYRIAQVGNYSMYKVKSALTDICRELGVDFQLVKLFTSIIDDDTAEGDFTDLVKCFIREHKLKDFFITRPEFQIYFEAIIGNPRSMGIHASATIISPKDENHETFFDWCPVIKNGDFLVTQWQGKEMEEAGYLKCDFLGLSQLTKFSRIIELLKTYNKDIPNIYNLDLKDKEVFYYFKNGWNEDVFQFGSPSQKKYSTQLQPDSVYELSLANALYRPGPMESGAHNKLVDIKFGKKQVEYDKHLEHITKDTYGLYAYQEQVMILYQYITDASLNEADNFRKLITKEKNKDFETNEKFVLYKTNFVGGYIQKFKVTEEYALYVWDKIISFASYGFNKSHSDTYAITGYIAQYLKVHYPLEFYTVSLQTANNSLDVLNIINEINITASIKLESPNVNYSNVGFATNGNDTIYWSLSSIYGCGEKTVTKFIEERNKNGLYYSFNEFLSRCGKILDKSSIVNFIYSGCFDEMCKIEHPIQRNKLLEKYDEFRNFSQKDKVALPYEGVFMHKYFWQLKMKKLCNFDRIDWEDVLKYTKNKFTNSMLIASKIEEYEVKRNNMHTVCGIILEKFERNTKTKKKILTLLVEQSNTQFNCVIWDNKYTEYNSILSQDLKGKIIVINATLFYDTYRKQNSIYSCDESIVEII